MCERSECAAFPRYIVRMPMHLILLMCLDVDGVAEALSENGNNHQKYNGLYVGIIKSCNGNDFYLMACNGERHAKMIHFNSNVCV